MSTIVPSGIGSFAGSAGAARSWANGPAKSILGSIRHALTSGVQDLAFHWVMDSTGNDTDDVPYVFARKLAALFPDRNLKQRFWSVDDEAWSWWLTGQQVSYLGERFRSFKWAATNATGIVWPSAEVGTFTGPDLTIIAKVKIPASPNASTICSQYQTTGNKRKFWLNITSASKLNFRASADGSADTVNTTETNAWTSLAGTDQWIKVVFDGDNGAGASAITFYSGNADGSVWTQRSTHTGTLVAALYDTTDVPFEVGDHRSTDTTPAGIAPYTGPIYHVELWDDTAGAKVNPVLSCAGMTAGLSERGKNYAGGGPEIQNWIAGCSGQKYSYFTDATRFPKIHPKIGSSGVMFVSLGHNERYYGSNLWDLLDAYLTQYRARCTVGNICFIGQNPRTPPARVGESDSTTAKLNRAIFDMVQCVNFDTAAWCAKNNIGYIDLHTPFYDHPSDQIFTNVDGVHPNPAGSDVRADLLLDQLMRA